MPRKLTLVKGTHRKLSLVYGLRLFESGKLNAVNEASAELADGTSERITMHVIEGTRAQIRAQLLRSLDAFFELQAEA